MFKSIVALIHDTVHGATETTAGRRVVAILDQQIDNCVRAAETARKALALASAQTERECTRLEGSESHAAAVQACSDGTPYTDERVPSSDVTGGFHGIAAERRARELERDALAREIAKLEKIVRQSEQRLVELRRGRRIATIAQRANRLRGDEVTSANLSAGALEEAGHALERLRRRQAAFDGSRADLTAPGVPAGKTDR